MGDKFDKFKSPENEVESPLLDESILYLSSNWSARMSIKTQHEYKNELFILGKIPKLDIQIVLDQPDSDDDEPDVEITDNVMDVNKT